MGGAAVVVLMHRYAVCYTQETKNKIFNSECRLSAALVIFPAMNISAGVFQSTPTFVYGRHKKKCVKLQINSEEFVLLKKVLT